MARAVSSFLHAMLGNDSEAAPLAAETHRLIDVDGEGVQWRSFRVLAASRLLARGDVDGAPRMMDACDRDFEPCWSAEVLRTRADLLARTGVEGRKAAGAMLQESLRLAREQEAGLREQRAQATLAALDC